MTYSPTLGKAPLSWVVRFRGIPGWSFLRLADPGYPGVMLSQEARKRLGAQWNGNGVMLLSGSSLGPERLNTVGAGHPRTALCSVHFPWRTSRACEIINANRIRAGLRGFPHPGVVTDFPRA